MVGASCWRWAGCKDNDKDNDKYNDKGPSPSTISVVLANSRPVLVIIIPLISAPLCILFRGKDQAFGIALLATWASFACACLITARVMTEGQISYELGGWPPPIGIEIRIAPQSLEFRCADTLGIGTIREIDPGSVVRTAMGVVVGDRALGASHVVDLLERFGPHGPTFDNLKPLKLIHTAHTTFLSSIPTCVLVLLSHFSNTALAAVRLMRKCELKAEASPVGHKRATVSNRKGV